MRVFRLRAITSAIVLALLAACTNDSKPPAPSSPATTTKAVDIAVARNAIERALRGNGGVEYIDSSLDNQYRKQYTVTITVTSNQFFADVAKTAVATATKVKTADLPEITVRTGSTPDDQSLVLERASRHSPPHLPPAALIDRAVALFSDQTLVNDTSGFSVRVTDPDLYVIAHGELDTAASSIALYRTLLAKWTVRDAAVRRLDVGDSFVILGDVTRRRLPVVPARTLAVWQTQISRTGVVASKLRPADSGYTTVYLTLSPSGDVEGTVRAWIDALVPVSRRFAVLDDGLQSSTYFAFYSDACSGPGSELTARIYRYYVTKYPNRPNVAALKSCR